MSVLPIAATVTACSVGADAEPRDHVTDSIASVEVGPESLDEGEWFNTWEEAAIAEATNLHPDLTGVTTERFELTEDQERLLVRADDGYCAVYGGMMLQGVWRANEIMPLDKCSPG